MVNKTVPEILWVYQAALITYGPNYIRNIRKAIGFNYIRKAGVLITYGTQKHNLSRKKGPCGHAQTQNKGCKYQKLHFSPKKGPCGHAHTQKTIFTKKQKAKASITYGRPKI